MRTSDQVERDAAVRFLAIAQDTLYVRQGTLNTVRALILGWLESQPDDRLGLMLLKVIDAARAGGPAYCSGTEERMTCQACTRGFHKHCKRCECCKKPKLLLCGITEHGVPCGKPAMEYQMGQIGKQVCCAGHRLQFLAMLGVLMENEDVSIS